MTTNFTRWRKPSRSTDSGNCVEVGAAPQRVGVRDTKDRDGGTLVVDHASWSAFVSAVKKGRLDV